MSKKRYEALFIHPNFCDGFWDNEETRYLDNDEVKEMLFNNLEYLEIEEVLNRSEIEENEESEKSMSNIKLAFEGLGLVLLGVFNVFWYFIKLISSVIIAGLISVKLGLSGYYWWFSSILLFCVINKIIFFGNSTNSYNELVDKYKIKSEENN